MASKLALFTVPAVALIAVVLAVNSVDAGPGLAAVALMTVAVAGGALFGVFADRLPVVSPKRGDDRFVPPRADRA